MPSGQILLDENKTLWLRFGANVNHFSAAAKWKNRLVLGSGNTGAYPNLT